MRRTRRTRRTRSRLERSSSQAYSSRFAAEADDDRLEEKERRARKKEELPRKEYRDRIKHKDEGSGEHPNDWTRFQMAHNLQALRTGHEPTLIRTLRKLHLRWWHAGVTSMTNLLKHAGLGENVIKLIPDIINTCKECGAWTSRPKDTQPSVSLAMRFNEAVETDLLFYKEHVIHHMLDRATRWHSAVISPCRTSTLRGFRSSDPWNP